MKILVTGGRGFLGKHLVPLLEKEGHELLVPFKIDGDNQHTIYKIAHQHNTTAFNVLSYNDLDTICDNWKPDAIIHLAGNVGGIGYNINNQGKLLYQNLQMGMNVINVATEKKISKLIMIGTTCSYPHIPKTIPFVEEELFDGMPEETNSGYGIAKRTLIKMGIEYHKQYGLNVVNLIPTNMVGEFDHFEDGRSHVIPALIKKFENYSLDTIECHCICHTDHNTRHIMACCENGVIRRWDVKAYVELWGDGSASREFLYAGDCARAIVMALNKDVGPEPINLGTGEEIHIKDLANIINKIGNYNCDIKWDTSKPNGQPRRCLDVTKAKDKLGWEATTSLTSAIMKTIEWYRNEQK